MNALVLPFLSDELSVLRRQVAVTSPDDAITVERATDHRTVLGPSLRSHEQALQEALRHPLKVSEQQQVDVYERVRVGEPLPRGLRAAVAVDDPRVTLQQFCVRLQIFV